MEKYNQFFAKISIFLKIRGYKKDGATFRYFNSENVALVNFQKSVESNPNEVKFTINLGVHIHTLFNFGLLTPVKKIELNQCNWKKRVGFLLPQKQDYWWRINSNSDEELLFNELEQILDSVILPTIENLTLTDNFLDFLEKDNETEFWEVTRLSYLAVFYAIMKSPKLNETLSLFKQSAIKNKVIDIYEYFMERFEIYKLKTGS